MDYNKPVNTDLNVSCICMGCMGFGDAGNGRYSWTIDEAHSRDIIGLWWEDLDYEKRMISINHSVTYYPRRGDAYKCGFQSRR